jgi:hypothetical protein
VPDEFSSMRRFDERPRIEEPFSPRIRHAHRFGQRQRENPAERETERDRMIFLWIISILAAAGIVAVTADLLIKRNGEFQSSASITEDPSYPPRGP